MQETRGSRVIIYFYDAHGQAIALRYRSGSNADWAYYYYDYNSRGDIVGLYAENGNPECTYTYDAWGKLLSVKNPAGTEMTSATYIGNLQSLKYRGYVYDRETGLYYLQSRYYDPVTHRFINADELLSTGTRVLGYNMFAYCGNKPIILSDALGKFPFILACIFVGGLVSVGSKIVSNCCTPEKKWYEGTLGALVGGAFYGGVFYATGGNVLASGYISSGVESLANEIISYTPWSSWHNGEEAKELNGPNLANSALSITRDTIVNGSITAATGKLGKVASPTNNGWFVPTRTYSCFFGNYADAAHMQSILQGIVQSATGIIEILFISSTKKIHPKNESHIQYFIK